MKKLATLTMLGLLAASAHIAPAAVLYSGGNPDQTGQSISNQSWNFYYSSNYYSRPYVNVSIAAGDQWTITGLQFYEASQVTLPTTSIQWDVRTDVHNFSGATTASGTTSNVAIVDTGTHMTGSYSAYEIYKYTVTLDTPVVLTGGQTYYFSAMLNRYTSPYVTNSLNTLMMYSDGTGQIGGPNNDGTYIWNKQQGYSLNLLTPNYELAFSVLGTSAVPEPASIGILATSALLLFRRRR